MRILIDIGHPGHVHLYKNLIQELKRKEYNVIVTIKNIPVAKELLQKYKIEFIELGGKKDTIIGKAFYQLMYNYKLFKLVKKNKIDIGIGTSITIAHLSGISKMRSIILDDDDDDVQPLFVKYAHPFANYLLSPNCLRGNRKRKDTIFYPGYHELAYLHPKRFTPDPEVLKEAGLSKKDVFFVLRFNAFKAHHDKDVRGISLENKIKLVNKLSKFGKVLITTEREIEPELKPYQIKITPEKIHHFLAFATMFIGDSQTMTSEAAVLGTPAIRSNTLVGRISYLEEQEKKYGLTYGFLPTQSKQMFEKIDELLSLPNLKEEWQKRRQHMLKDKIDVTTFMVWFVENYPESARIMRDNPDYQYRFK
ncbi:hypothetical protein ES708_26909 [subsurface metagenome]